MGFVCPARRGPLLVALALVVVLPQTLAAQDTEAGNRRYRAAAGLQNGGQFDLAAQAWSEFLEKDPAHSFAAQASLNLGICQLKSNQLDKALATLGDVVQKYPKLEMLDAAYLYLGIAQYSLAQSGKPELYAAAGATFDKLIADYPKGKYLAQAIFYRGECDYAQGKKEEAAGNYARLVGEFPKDDLVPDALYALGVTQEELGQFEAAGKTYDKFTEQFPKHALVVEVGMRRGETLFGTKEYAAAAEWFGYAAQSKGFQMADHATVRQADALAQLKKYAEAAALYASVAKQFPQSPEKKAADLAGGKCYYLAGDMDNARRLLAELLSGGDATAAEAAHWFARSLLKDKKPTEALAAVEKVLPTSAKSPMAVELLMDQADAAYEIAERRAGSVALYAAIAEQHPDDPLAESALSMASFAALGQGDYPAAVGYADAFVKRFPKSKFLPDVSAVAAEGGLQLGKLAEAEKLYAQLIQSQPEHPDAEAWKIRYALVLHLEKKYQETIAALEPILGEIRAKPALAEARYLMGSSQAQLKQHDAAVESLEASLAADPKWRQADETLLVLANTRREQGKLAEAIAAARRLIAELPQSKLLDQAHYWLGEYLYASGDLPAAAAEYKAVIDQWPKSPLVPHALFGLGWSQLGAKDYAGAEKTLDRLVTESPKHTLIPRARFARGTARQQQGKFAEAVEDVEALLAADPSAKEKADARYVLGLCQTGLKKPADAAATFQKLLEEDPKYAGADKTLYELAWALESSGNADAAAERFDQLAKEHPQSPLAAESLYHVAEAKYRDEKYAEAAVRYFDAAERAADKTLKEKANHKLGWSYFNDDKFADAQKTFLFQRTTFPEGTLADDAAFMEGECLMKLGKHAEALAAYEAVQKPAGKDFKALSLLHAGQAAAQLKQWDKSLALLTESAAKFPEAQCLPEVLYEQGWAQQNLGKLDEAAKLYASVVEKTNREVAARAQFMIGEILFEQKKHADAIRTFYEVMYGYSYPEWQANATYEAARCYEVLKKPSQAAKLYAELIEKYPKSEKAPDAKKRLEELK